MRTNHWSSMRAIAAFLFAAVGGPSFADDPKPQPIQPAAAKIVESAETPHRLMLTFREDVRYFSEEGKELRRIDYSIAKKADAELETGTLSIGTDGFSLTRYLPSCGRPGPDGVLPLESSAGLKLMAPGQPPTIKLLDANTHAAHVAGWYPDGQSFVLRTAESNALVANYAHATHRVEVKTGAREKLPFGSEHCVIDISGDGTRFLTQRSKPMLLVFAGLTDGLHDLCILDAKGTIERERTVSNARFETSGHRLAPDGRRTAEIAKPKDAKAGRAIVSVTVQPQPDRTNSHYAHYRRDDGEVECRAVAWSPDGKRIVSLWTPATWKDKLAWHVVVCDPTGGGMRTLATIETKGDEQIRSLDWR